MLLVSFNKQRKNSIMTRKRLKLALIIVAASMVSNCTVLQAQTDNSSLRKAYKNDFLIGTAMNTPQIEEREPNAAALIPQQFNAATPENCMKSEIIHPAWDQYNFDLADKLVAYGKKYDIKINAHNLIWHSQLPAYVRHIQNADSLKTFFKNHITTVASRYDGKVYSWDVVNEALNEDGTLRNSIFLQKLGPNYIVEAFRLAQKAAPNTQLYYNDYNIEEPKKRAGAIAIIKKIKAAGVRIDGVGIQGHWHLGSIPFKNIEESIEEFSKLGVKVMFTELDLSVLPNPWDHNTADVSARAENNSAAMNPYTKGLPDSVQHMLTRGYVDLFALFLKHKDVVSRVTFWGVNDSQSWLNNFPIRGRTNYALPFDRNFKPKEVYYQLIELAK